MKPEGTGWIRAGEAAQKLSITSRALHGLALRRHLTRWQSHPGLKGSPLYYRQDEIRELAYEPDRLRRAQMEIERRERALAREQVMPPPDTTDLITSREAAAILGISLASFKELIYRRRLVTFQMQTGRSGSPHYVLRSHVESLRDDARYQKVRQSRDKKTSLEVRPQEAVLPLDHPDIPPTGLPPTKPHAFLASTIAI